MSRRDRRRRVRAALFETCRRSPPINPVDAYIGGRLRRTRIFRNLTRHELATGIGATEQEVEAFESGMARIDAYSVRRIGRVLNVLPSFFLRRSSRDLLNRIETKPSPARREASNPSLDGPEGERVREIFESINSSRIRELLVDLMLVITTSESSGRSIM